MIIDPKSEKFEECPNGCGGKDIRVHFTKDPEGNPASEDMHIHWCVECGVGHNIARGYVDCLIFGSCVQQRNDVKNNG